MRKISLLLLVAVAISGMQSGCLWHRQKGPKPGTRISEGDDMHTFHASGERETAGGALGTYGPR